MKLAVVPFLTLILLASGCGETDTIATEPAPTGGDADTSTDLGDSSSEPSAMETDGTTESAAAAGTGIALTPENTRIQFVGIHTDKTKDDRIGHFQEFSGSAIVEGAALKSVRVDIETRSLTTPISDLTAHLKNTDFFDVNQHPRATFASTAIEDAGDGKVNITGDLTLLGTTKSITFPATVTTDGGLKLNAEFEIDRTEWGMDYRPDQVEKIVPMTISVDA